MMMSTTAAPETVTRLQQQEIIAVLQAARRARAAYSGPVGEFVSRELFGYIQVGRRASPTALVSRLLEDLEGLPDASDEAWPVPAVLAARRP